MLWTLEELKETLMPSQVHLSGGPRGRDPGGKVSQRELQRGHQQNLRGGQESARRSAKTEGQGTIELGGTITCM